MFFRYVRRHDAGFSLVELLIAIFVLSLVLSMAFSSVKALSNTKSLLSEEEAALVDAQKMISMIHRDLTQAVELEIVDNSQAVPDEENDGAILSFKDASGRVFVYAFVDGVLLKRESRYSKPKGDNTTTLRLMEDLLNVGFEEPAVTRLSDGSDFTTQQWLVMVAEHSSLGDIRQLISYSSIPSEFLTKVDSLPLSINANQTQTQLGSAQATYQQNTGETLTAKEFDW